jgi:replication fork protection complex subunit TIMELESS/Tof1/Swi1
LSKLIAKLLFYKLPKTLYYLQHGEDDVQHQPKRPRAAAELEVRPGRSVDDQIAVVVAALLDDQKSDVLDSIKTMIMTAINEIRAWEESAEARRLAASEAFIVEDLTASNDLRPPIGAPDIDCFLIE